MKYNKTIRLIEKALEQEHRNEVTELEKKIE